VTRTSGRLAAELGRRYAERYPDEAARSLEGLAPEEIAPLVNALPTARGADLVERLLPDVAEAVLETMGEPDASRLLAAMEAPRAAALLGRIAPERRERLLAALDGHTARELRALASHPRDSAGGLMDPRVTAFRPDETAADVLERLRAQPERRVQRIYVVDDHGHLVGSIALQDVAVAPPGERLDGLMTRSPLRVLASAGREEILEAFETRRVPSLAVVDFEGRLVGVIPHASLVDAAQEEASVDVQTMTGASRDERALSSPLLAVRKRLPWLQLNLATAFLAAAVVGLFEDTIARFTALAVLLPVVAGQSGNAGMQALAVTMRGLALREVRLRHCWRVAAKEVAAALLNGLAVAATTCAGVYFWSGSRGLTLVVGASMWISMSLAGLFGALIPMLLTALRQDPAQASSIVLTTLTDVVGFLSFLGIATLLSSLL
jgi:magnesium transporter